MSERKPIGKRLRFDIFKRDDFTCQYCGAHPPAIVLEIDHIVPVSAGGGNDEENLITACFNCNRGKAAIGLEVVPQSLADKAAEVAEREEQLAGYNEVLNRRRERREADIWRVIDHWTGKEETSNEIYSSIGRFIDRLGVHEVLDAVDITLASGIRGRRQFKYLCGVCWNKVRRAAGEP